MADVTSPDTVNCPVCNGTSRPWAENSNVVLLHCDDCEHNFSRLKGAPEPYDPAYFEQTHRNWFDNPNIPLFDWITDRLKDLPFGARVLDVGCGRGDLLRHIRKSRPDLKLSGIDLSAQDLGDGIDFLRADISDFEPHGAYDAVLSLAVIEHISDIRSFANKLSSFCVPGGTVIVMTLDDTSLLYAAARMLRKVGWALPFDRVYDPHHLHHFRPGSLSRLLRGAGLNIEKIHAHNAPIQAMDIPIRNPSLRETARLGVRFLFGLGGLCNRTYLQTIVARRT